MIGAKFYYPHALADSNQNIQIREKMLEFSSTVLSRLSLYPDWTNNNNNNDRLTAFDPGQPG